MGEVGSLTLRSLRLDDDPPAAIRLTLVLHTHIELQDQTAAIAALPGPPGWDGWCGLSGYGGVIVMISVMLEAAEDYRFTGNSTDQHAPIGPAQESVRLRARILAVVLPFSSEVGQFH
jgi:hypothetical protein